MPPPESCSGRPPSPDPIPLDGLRHRRLDSLSLGQRKRVALAATLLGSPDVTLLDEPTNGLDPLAVRGLREALMVEREQGRNLVVSSHHLDELQRIADVLVFMKGGRAAGTWTRANSSALISESWRGSLRSASAESGGERLSLSTADSTNVFHSPQSG